LARVDIGFRALLLTWTGASVSTVPRGKLCCNRGPSHDSWTHGASLY
jgi:hypothetical protein